MANREATAVQKVEQVVAEEPKRSPEGPEGLSVLWKTEEWLAVWIGFLVIILILAGVSVKLPSFKWTTDREFASYVAKLGEAKSLESLGSAAAAARESGLEASLASLAAATVSMDRPAVAAAARKVEDASKTVKDAALKA